MGAFQTKNVRRMLPSITIFIKRRFSDRKCHNKFPRSSPKYGPTFRVKSVTEPKMCAACKLVDALFLIHCLECLDKPYIHRSTFWKMVEIQCREACSSAMSWVWPVTEKQSKWCNNLITQCCFKFFYIIDFIYPWWTLLKFLII